jgi:magnesium-protoporphyrin O-methyltransferase
MRDCCQIIDGHFETAKVAGKLLELEHNGPPPETRHLIDMLTGAGVQGLSVLDVGAGSGIVADQLLRAGAARATLVDISSAYLEAARQRLVCSGVYERAELRLGDVTALADAIAPADVVTLDKVICCYPDGPGLVQKSLSKAKHFYGATYPREHVFVHLSFWFENIMRRLRGQPFRTFVHPIAEIEALLLQAGFERQVVRQTFAWRIVLFERVRNA